MDTRSDYRTRITAFVDASIEESSCLSRDRNQVLSLWRRSGVTMEDIAFVVGQYCSLPATIVELLKGAARRTVKQRKIAEELGRNIQQERGSETGGVPHYEILCLALQRELALDVAKVTYEPCTRAFLAALRAATSSSQPFFAAGAALALEASATPELFVVQAIVRLAAAALGNPLASDGDGEQRISYDTAAESRSLSLNAFLLIHIDPFEKEHRDKLLEAVVGEISADADLRDMERGFHKVLGAMDQWWTGLALRCGSGARPDMNTLRAEPATTRS